MAILATRKRIRIPIRSNSCDLTLSEILSDPIVEAMMQADGVDPVALETQLESIARKVATDRPWT